MFGKNTKPCKFTQLLQLYQFLPKKAAFIFRLKSIGYQTKSLKSTRHSTPKYPHGANNSQIRSSIFSFMLPSVSYEDKRTSNSGLKNEKYAKGTKA